MGMFEGGILMTILFFTTIGFFFSTSILAEKNPAAISSVKCLPNDATISQYGGLDNNSMDFQNCFQDVNASSSNISTSQADRPDIFASLANLIPGGKTISQTISGAWFYISVLAKGWVLVLETIIGTNSPLSVLIWLIGIPLQLLQLYFFMQFILFIKGIFTGGASVR